MDLESMRAKGDIGRCEGLVMNDNLQKQMVFESKRKSMGIAYLLWFFFGFFGVHRFYAGKTKSAIVQLVLTLTGVGLVVNIPWLLADLFMIPGMIHERNLDTMRMLAFADSPGAPGAPEAPPAEQPRIQSEADRKRQAMLEDLKSMGYRKERPDTSHLYR